MKITRWSSLLVIWGLVSLALVMSSNLGEAAGLGGLFKRKSTAEKERALHAKVEDAVASFKKKDSGIERFFKDSVGYAVFPAVVKAGVGIGGAMGKGEVIKGKKVVGTSVLTQGSFGFQLGAQSYAEIIFFHNDEALELFQSGSFEFGAQVSAVALTAGASADATFDQGMAIFTMAKGGLMYEASLGGQVFTFEAK